MGSSSHGTIVKHKADFHSEKQQQRKKKRERERKREREEEEEGKKEKKNVLAFAKSTQISPHFQLCIVTTDDQTNKPKGTTRHTASSQKIPLCPEGYQLISFVLSMQYFIPGMFALFPSYLYPVLVRSG